MRIAAVIVAGGSGSRVGGNLPKQYIKIKGKTILEWTVEKFASVELIDEIVVVAGKEYENLILKMPYEITAAQGGSTRAESVHNGLMAIENADYVCIHDAARPFVTKEIINDTINAAIDCGAAAPGIFSKDTIKQIDKDGYIVKTIDRDGNILIQTPQTFRYDLILDAHEKADGKTATDDTGLVERLGHKVKITKGSEFNFKITTPFDLNLAKTILEDKT